MSATVIGPSGGLVGINAQSTITGYMVIEETDGNNDVSSDDIENPSGGLAARLIFRNFARKNLTLISSLTSGATTGAGFNPAVDFPEGGLCVLTGYTTWYVDSCQIVKSKTARRVTVQITNLGTLTTV